MSLRTRIDTKIARKVRILTIDIETSPNLAHVWGLWNQNVGLPQLLETGRVICFAAKWYDNRTAEFSSDFLDGHSAMVQRAWDLLNEADVVVHYNGNRFDIPALNREFALAGLPPPRPFRSVDLYALVKARFRFPSNKLDHVASALGLGHKVKHEGHELWLKCVVLNDPAAWERMRKYNIGDVKLTERLLDRLRAWASGLHIGVIAGHDRLDAPSCSNCGSTNLTRDGWVTTPQTRYAAYRCKDCGTPIRNNYIRNRSHTRPAR